MKITKKEVYYIFIYSIITILSLIFLFYNYEYISSNFISFIASFFVFGYICILDFNKNKDIFSLGIVFNIFGISYVNYYIIESILSNQFIHPNYFWAMNISYLSMLSFNIVFYVSKQDVLKISNKTVNISYNIKKIRYFLIALLLFSLFVEFYYVIRAIGISNYFFMSRAEKSLYMSDYGIASFYKSTISLVAIVSLYGYFKKKNKIDFFIFLFSFIISLFNAYINGSRAELITIILPVIFIFKHYNTITNKMVVFYMLVFALVLGLWKSFYSQNRELSYDSEFNTWYKICYNVRKDDVDYLYGKSYGLTIINLILPITKTESLSTWYVKKYEPNVYLRGGGRGFSGALEAFINFGYLGNMLVYGIYGFLLKQIKKDYDLGIIFYMIILLSLYQFFRSESYSLWKNMMWFKIYPILLIYYISKIRLKRI
ncbi:O-antigen polymerase [Thomasclavelia sp.]|uniref:O-antigen polymerase n=1 Tax=Thomasclavelia sp. TaxID=3025757 RepID=UPI0025E1E713|nr:O-antigen polymerase [Thomasclavelia sp.]